MAVMDIFSSTYVYAGNNPVSFNDPLGLYKVSDHGYTDAQLKSMWRDDRDWGGYRGSYLDWSLDSGCIMCGGGGGGGGMLADAQAVKDGSMDINEYAAKYGTRYKVVEHGFEEYYSIDRGETWVYKGYTFDHYEFVAVEQAKRPAPVDLFQSDQDVLNGLAEHFRYFNSDERTEAYHLRDIVKSIEAPKREPSDPLVEAVNYLVNYSSSINMTLFERNGKGKLVGHNVEFMVSVHINTSHLLDINWKYNKQNENLTIWNPRIGDNYSLIFSNGSDRLIILKFTDDKVDDYLSGN